MRKILLPPLPHTICNKILLDMISYVCLGTQHYSPASPDLEWATLAIIQSGIIE